jgi:hypothetical protein
VVQFPALIENLFYPLSFSFIPFLRETQSLALTFVRLFVTTVRSGHSLRDSDHTVIDNFRLKHNMLWATKSYTVSGTRVKARFDLSFYGHQLHTGIMYAYISLQSALQT